MENEQRIMMICIDIGMTASAAAWRNPQTSVDWRIMFDNSKIPTKLALDTRSGKSPSMIWGTACINLPRHIHVQECFKAVLDEKYLPNPNSESPTANDRANAQRWIGDYIHCLCHRIVIDIDSDARIQHPWKNDTIHWNFTVPGSWADFPTVANFKRLAEDAVYRCIGDQRKNGLASSARGYVAGNTVLSCDIGGATTDIEGPGIIRTPMQLDIHPAGVRYADVGFDLHVQQILKNAGVPNYLEVAQIVFEEFFRKTKATFTGRELSNWFTINLPTCEASNWPPPGNLSATCTRINVGPRQKQLLIHKETIINIFGDFVDGIEANVDLAINKIAKNGARLSVIGICGGGSRINYLRQRLRRRYEGNINFLDYNDYAFKPEMATLLGNTMLCDQQLVTAFCEQMRFGIKTGKDDVVWGKLGEVETQSTFQSPYAMEAHFIENTHTLFASVRHDLVEMPRAAPLLQKYSAACQSANSKAWRVKIDLIQVQTPPVSLNKKYQVICKVSGVWEVEILAETGVPAKRINCVLINGDKGFVGALG